MLRPVFKPGIYIQTLLPSCNIPLIIRFITASLIFRTLSQLSAQDKETELTFEIIEKGSGQNPAAGLAASRTYERPDPL